MARVTTSVALSCTDSILFENDTLDGWSQITSAQSR